MKLLISILITFHNATQKIAESLQSAISQIWPRKEIIVADNLTCSTESEAYCAIAVCN